jgi:hypothetical protein
MRRLIALLTLVVFAAACGDSETTDPNNGSPNIVDGDSGNTSPNNEADAGSDDAGTDPDMGEEPTCEDECTPGSQTCSADQSGYTICGQFDSDPCLESSAPVACANGFTCDSGQCVSECRNLCPASGAICADDQTVEVCGNFDDDTCREPGAPVTCGTGERCEAGACVDENAPCSDECAANGETVCFGDAVRTCGDFDADSCLDLGPPTACSLGEVCSAGACVPFCQDTCPSEGATECSGDGVRTCGEFDGDACLEWGPTESCGADETCSAGSCGGDCIDECTAIGQASCSADGGVRLCGQYDSDACLDLASALPCPTGFGCANGLCVATCTDECTSGASQCGADGTSLETCGDFDDDPCTEWGGNVACPGGASCVNDACDLPCSDECTTDGTTECVAGQNATRSCGQFDLDSCLEWSTQTACETFETCTAGACELGATPNAIVINELSYDAVSSDTAVGTTVFIELWGPAGASLDGWQVVGVNGSNGADYNAIDLSGEVLGSDGYFVIAHPNADATLAAFADLLDPAADLQNGPDSVQLRWRGRVVDALGYGSFGASDTFAGEGSAAPSTAAGESIARDASHTDTDDNSADFSVVAVPTPGGGMLGCADDCTTAGETRCNGSQVETCGDYDADSCLEWSAPNNCPVAGESCVGTSCQAPCTDDCSAMGATQCLGVQVQTCGNYDADSCLEWSQTAACPNSGDICVINACQSSSAPEVVLITPQGTTQSTQGNVHRILVDPTPAPGRTISQVEFFADGVSIGTSTATPHETNYTVPASVPTGSLIALQARATDSAGEVGSSAIAYLDIQNDLPIATFTATVTNTTTATVDASAVTDTETAAADLEVCWDWNNDGTCDTAYSTTKVATHDFGASGNYTIGMTVRDAQGQTASVTRDISFADVQYIGGQTITSTLWYGTIIVTGDITVGVGETLTIADGTSVLFINADQNNDGVGDYEIEVDGDLVVNGTAASPVVFSVQGNTSRNPGAWNAIYVDGTATIDHAEIEYADVGIDVRSGGVLTLTNSTVRQTQASCVKLSNGDNSVLTDVTTTQCGQDGVWASAGSTGVSITNLTSTDNGRHGLHVSDVSGVTATTSTFSSNAGDGVFGSASTVDLSSSTSELNSGAGARFIGDSSGVVEKNQLRSNGAEGLGFESTDDGHPSTVATLNNIYSNATSGSSTVRVDDPSATLTASVTCCTTVTSSTYTAAAGETLRRAYINFSDGSYSSYDGARLMSGSTTIWSRTSDFTGWVRLPPGTTSIYLEVYDTAGSSDLDRVSVTQLEVIEKTDAADVVALTESGTVSARKNYLGTFPDVLSRIEQLRSSALDVQGFVGTQLGSNFDTGPYYGGESLPTTTLSGTIYITGDVLIPAGEVVGLSAGTVVELVQHDQDGDGEGDHSITANGSFDVNGAVGNEVVFRTYGAAAGDALQSIELNGSAANSSVWTDVDISGVKTALTIRGDSSVTRANIAAGSRDGVAIVAGTGATLAECTIDGAGRYGLFADTATAATISKSTIRNGSDVGVRVQSGATPTIVDSTIRDNSGHGIEVENSSPSIDYNLITYNGGAGITYLGTAAGQTTYSVVKFNDDVGVLLSSTDSGSPNPVINYSNIYGNAVVGSTVVTNTDPSATLTASVTCCTTVQSGTYTAPAGQTIRRVYINFSDGSYSSYDGARLMSGSTTIWSRTSDFTGWVFVPAGTTSLRLEVYDTAGSSDLDRVTVTDMELLSPDTMASYEMSAATESGTVDAKFNYWTPNIVDVPSKINETRTNAVDYSGYTGAEYPSGTVTEVGPRP